MASNQALGKAYSRLPKPSRRDVRSHVAHRQDDKSEIEGQLPVDGQERHRAWPECLFTLLMITARHETQC